MWEITPANFDPKWATGPHTRSGHILWKVGISGTVDRPLLAVSWAHRGGVHSPCMHDSRGAMHSIRDSIDIRSSSTEDATGTRHYAVLSTSGIGYLGLNGRRSLPKDGWSCATSTYKQFNQARRR